MLPKFAGDTSMRVMKEFRRAMDPSGILNPGKMFGLTPVSDFLPSDTCLLYLYNAATLATMSRMYQSLNRE